MNTYIIILIFNQYKVSLRSFTHSFFVLNLQNLLGAHLSSD